MLPKPMAGLIVILAVCTLGLTLTPPGASPAYAGQEDAALFQEALSAYGQWLNHGQHGLVWRPRQVSRNWQPYANGRWVPTQDGYVFETDEPWGWATYHYGNWLTTNDHGWVWVPGRTWYPHTVNWRTSDENVGWAPVPPPESLGSDSFYSDEYPMDYDSSGINSYRGYSNSISPLNWIFIRSTDFLMGWGQPYSSAYSYYGSGVLLSPQYIPVVYARTVYVSNYVSPGYAANAYYNWGPPVTYITRVTNINNLDIDRRCRETRLANLRNVMPPDNVTRRHPAWREILPARHGHSRPAPNFRLASGKLNYPNAVPAPASLVANNKGTRPSSPPAGKLPMTESGKTIVIDNKSLAHSPSRPMQLQQSTAQSQHPDNSRNGNHCLRVWTEKAAGIISEKSSCSAHNRPRAATACLITTPVLPVSPRFSRDGTESLSGKSIKTRSATTFSAGPTKSGAGTKAASATASHDGAAAAGNDSSSNARTTAEPQPATSTIRATATAGRNAASPAAAATKAGGDYASAADTAAAAG